MQFRDLKRQYKSNKAEIDRSVSQVLEVGQFISGKQVGELEEKLAEYVGVKHCISCANGTDALQLALMAWDIGDGDAVFVPDFTFFSSGEAVSAVGGTPIFIDVRRDTFNIDPDKLEQAIIRVEQEGRLNPKAVIAVDLFGQPAQYDRISVVAKKHGLKLLEDGAQGFGGSIGNRKVCSFGDISTTSFFPAKPLGCYGDGGAVFTDNDEWADLIKSYAVHGKNKDDKYDNLRIGMNSRLDTIQAAVLLVKLDILEKQELDQVNQVAIWYRDMLSGSGVELPNVLDGFISSWAQYTIILPDRVDRSALQEHLKGNGIPTMVYYRRPMHMQGAFSGTDSSKADCRVTEDLCRSVLSLPMGPYITRDEVEAICNHIKSFVGK